MAAGGAVLHSMVGAAPLTSASNFFDFRTVADLVWLSGVLFVAIAAAIARFIYVVKHRHNPGVGFTQRQRYQNAVRRRQELAAQAAQAAQAAEVNPQAAGESN